MLVVKGAAAVPASEFDIGRKSFIHRKKNRFLFSLYLLMASQAVAGIFEEEENKDKLLARGPNMAPPARQSCFCRRGVVITSTGCLRKKAEFLSLLPVPSRVLLHGICKENSNVIGHPVLV